MRQTRSRWLFVVVVVDIAGVVKERAGSGVGGRMGWVI